MKLLLEILQIVSSNYQLKLLPVVWQRKYNLTWADIWAGFKVRWISVAADFT